MGHKDTRMLDRVDARLPPELLWRALAVAPAPDMDVQADGSRMPFGAHSLDTRQRTVTPACVEGSAVLSNCIATLPIY
jgi:hypothetical protein